MPAHGRAMSTLVASVLVAALQPHRALAAQQCVRRSADSVADQTALLQQGVDIAFTVAPDARPAARAGETRRAHFVIQRGGSEGKPAVDTNASTEMLDIVGRSSCIASGLMTPNMGTPSMTGMNIMAVKVAGKDYASAETRAQGDITLSAWKLVVFGLGSVAVFYVLAYSARTWEGVRAAPAAALVGATSEAVPASSVGPSEPLPISTVLYRIRWLIPVVLLKAFGVGVTEPSKQYIDINFFAGHHTDLARDEVRCQLSLMNPHCQAGVRDVMRLQVGMNFIGPVMSFLFAPLIGAISDAYGRRRVIAICKILIHIDIAFRACYVYFDWSLYISYWLTPLALLPYLPVYYAYVIDMTVDPSTVVVAMAMIEAITLLCVLGGMFAGVGMSMNWAYTSGFIAATVNVIYTCFVLPESLADGNRKPVKRSNLIPGLGLKILLRNKLIRTLAVLSILSGFQQGCFNLMSARFLQLYLGWNMKKTYIADIILMLSMMLWLGVAMKPLARRIGEVGCIFFCNFLSGIGLIAFFYTHHMFQIYALEACCIGASALTGPALSSLYSRMVPENEQGLMQGSLDTLTNISHGIGGVFGLIMFQATDLVFNRSTIAGGLITIYVVLLKIAVFYLVWTLRNLVEEHKAKSGKAAVGDKSTMFQ